MAVTRRVHVASMVCSIVLMACGGGLRRSAAFEQIRNAHDSDMQSVLLDVPVTLTAQEDARGGTDTVRALVTHGFLAAAGPARGGDRVYRLTQKGEQAASGWTVEGRRHPASGLVVTYRVALAMKRVRAVTGVHVEGSQATVEYTWCWEPTEVGTGAVDTGEQQATAAFRRFDDGWRLVE